MNGGSKGGNARALSPIERMIDAATGYRPDGKPPPEFVTLRCPECKRTMRVKKDRTDPPGTAVVEAVCDKCPGEDRGGVFYFDAQGQEIFSDGKPRP